MRFIFWAVVLIAVSVCIAGFSLGWFGISKSNSSGDSKSGLTLTVDPNQIRKDRDTVVSWFQPSHTEFQKQSEIRIQEMEKSLSELKAKAKTANAETKEQMDLTIADLSKKTDSARDQLKELANSSKEGYDAIKTSFVASMTDLKAGYDKAATRFQ